MNVAPSGARIRIILALALMLVGFGFVMQLRTYERLTERLETESEGDLVEIIDHLDGQIEDIRKEIVDSRIKLLQYNDTNTNSREILAQTRAEITDLTKLTGTTGVVGAGIVIEIENEENLLTGFDIRQIIEELRVSEAWAIAVNGRRVDHRSSLWRRAGRLYLDGAQLNPRLKIEALGPSMLLRETITLPSGIRDQLNTVKGVRVSVREEADIRLDRVKAKRSHRFAKAVEKTIKQ